MSGRYENEMHLKHLIENKIKNSPAVVDEYYCSLTGSGKSFETTYRYINYVLSFIDFTFGKNVKEDFYLYVKPVHINKYIASLRTKQVNGKTEKTSDSIRGGHWSALNSFFQFLTPEYMNSNPVEKTKRPKNKDNPKVTFLTPEEIAQVMKNVNDKAQYKFRNRDLCILKLGFSTGLRVSAIVQIDINDIDFKNNQIKVTEKGDYDNYIMFGDNLKTQMLKWLEDREKYFSNSETNALFVSARGTRLSHDMVDFAFKKYANGVTDKKVHPHVMRHSCATNLYEKTGDIYLCAKQLNHKNVSTTQRYAELSTERQRHAASVLDDMI